MQALQTKLLAKEQAYDGAPLGSHWAYRSFGLLGDSLVAFVGPCDVRIDALADLEDARAGAFIYSPKMLHFVLELFGPSLETAAARQWLLVACAQEEINRRLKGSVRVERRGNDLWYRQGKLSVSIAAPTPLSVKVHLGINILTKGAPVAAAGLAQLKVRPSELAKALLKRAVDDHAKLAKARMKVRQYP